MVAAVFNTLISKACLFNTLICQGLPSACQPSGGRYRRVLAVWGQPDLHSGFQDSQEYKVTLCFKTRKQNKNPQTKKTHLKKNFVSISSISLVNFVICDKILDSRPQVKGTPFLSFLLPTLPFSVLPEHGTLWGFFVCFFFPDAWLQLSTWHSSICFWEVTQILSRPFLSFSPLSLSGHQSQQHFWKA